MDPASIVGLVSACLSLAEKTTKAIHGSWELYTRYQAVGRNVSVLVERLSTVRSALLVLSTWIKSYLLKQAGAGELVASLEGAIASCHSVLAGIQELVEGVRVNKSSDKIKFLWNESTIDSLSNSLDSQIGALNLVVSIMHLYAYEPLNRRHR